MHVTGAKGTLQWPEKGRAVTRSHWTGFHSVGPPGVKGFVFLCKDRFENKTKRAKSKDEKKKKAPSRTTTEQVATHTLHLGCGPAKGTGGSDQHSMAHGVSLSNR